MIARSWALRSAALAALLLVSTGASLLTGGRPDMASDGVARNSPRPDDPAGAGPEANARSSAAVSRAGEQTRNEQQVWLPLNDGLTRHAVVTSVAFDPKDAGHLYVGTAGPDGLWISDDRGASGAPAGGLLAGQAVYALWSEPGQLAAATAQGLYLSGDGGRTWEQEPGPPGTPVYALARDSSGALLAGGEGPIIYRLAPTGGSSAPPDAAREVPAGWKSLSPLPGGTAVLALAVAERGYLLAGTDGAGLWRSRDGGQSWENVAEIGRTFVAALSVAEADGRTAFARTRRGLYVTTDGGESWREAAARVPGRIDAVGLGPGTGEALIGTSEGEVYRFGPGGARPTRLGTGLGRAGTFGALAVAPDRPSLWYAGTSNGLYISSDGGQSWEDASGGPGRPEAGALAQGPDGALYLGNGDGLFRSAGAVNDRWEAWGQGLPADRVQAIAFLPATDGQADRRAADGLAYAGLASQGLYRSQDGGRHWTATGWAGHGVPALLVDRADPRHLYIRAAYERIYESRDAGEHWDARWDGLGLSRQVISMAADPWQAGGLFAGADDGLFLSADGGDSWQSAGPGLTGQTVFAIAFNPEERGHVYAGLSNGAYRSSDGGKSWMPWGEGLEDVTVTALVFDPGSGAAYAGTKYRGVFVTRDGGETWLQAGLESVTVNHLLLAADGEWLLAATDHGVFGQRLEAR